jgi:hemerythrin-like domain-containing protein
MPSLLSDLLDEHRSIAEVLGCLDHQTKIFESGEQPDYDVVLAAIDYFEEFPQQFHHPKEDLIYQRLCARSTQAAADVGDLAKAHEQLRAHFVKFSAAIREVLVEGELPRDSVAGWVHDFIDRQRRHMAMEEAIFFPAAESALTAQDWQELAMAAPKDADPLRGSEPDARFKAFHRHIVAWDTEDRQKEG